MRTRKISRIVIHCSGASASQTARSIIDYHKRPVEKGGRGWKNPGYHYIVEASGLVVVALEETRIANGAKGYNADSIHICYTGGVDSEGKPCDTRTPGQKRSLLMLLKALRRRFPKIPIVGHRDLSPDVDHNGKIDPYEWIKACPSFDAAGEYAGI